MGKYTGKKAVVTGGTHGMGLATVKALLAGGAEVLLTGRNEQNLAAARRELEARALNESLTLSISGFVERLSHVHTITHPGGIPG